MIEFACLNDEKIVVKYQRLAIALNTLLQVQLKCISVKLTALGSISNEFYKMHTGNAYKKRFSTVPVNCVIGDSCNN